MPLDTPSDNIFSQLPKDLTSEVFDTLVQSKHLRIERITSLGHHTPKDD